MIPVTFAYGNACIAGLPFDPIASHALANSERIVITCDAADDLRKRLVWTSAIDKACLYHNFWGCASPVQDPRGWQKGPQDLSPGLPLIRSPKGPYPYRIDKFFEQKWLENCHEIMCSDLWGACLGLFGDDRRSHVRDWNLTPAQQAIVWPNGSNRNLDPVEDQLRTFATLSRKGPLGILVNGASPLGIRCWEDPGKWILKSDVEANAKPYDVILVYGVNAAGTGWSKVATPGTGWAVGTSFLTVFRWARSLAIERNLGLALGYAVSPSNGYASKCSPHRWSNPELWVKL